MSWFGIWEGHGWENWTTSWPFAETEGDAELGRGPGAASGLERCGGRVRWEQSCVRPAVVLDACVAHHRRMSTPTFIAVLDFSVSASDRYMPAAPLHREGSANRSLPG